MALVDAIRSHVFAPKRIHADDTTVPVLPKEGLTGQLWPYVRHDRPFVGPPELVRIWSGIWGAM
ncbi:transposase [Bradyrhizobium sp. 25ACV]